GYVSHIEPSNYFYLIIQSTLGILGLLSPVIIAFILIYPDPVLRRDLKVRMFNLKEITPFYAMVTFFVMLASILLAQAISLLFDTVLRNFHFLRIFHLQEGFSLLGSCFLLLLY